MRNRMMLKPGKYRITPFLEERGNRAFASLDPEAEMAGERTETVVVSTLGGIVPLTSRNEDETQIVITLDLTRTPQPDGIATTTAFGPLTIASRYLLTPCETLTANTAPAEQDAINWVSFEITDETELRVEHQAFYIGDRIVDVTRLSDVSISIQSVDGMDMDWDVVLKAGRQRDSTSRNVVAKAGDPVHTILSKGTWTYDDGVLILLTFTDEMLGELRALDGDVAKAFADDLAGQARRGMHHTVLRPAIGWFA